MIERERFDNGTFAPKSSQIREVRSLRLTDKTWKVLGDTAELKGITRADLIEELATNGTLEESTNDYDSKEKLVEKISELTSERDELLEQLSNSRNGLDLDDIQKLRKDALASLRLGKQSDTYKRLDKVFSTFIKANLST